MMQGGRNARKYNTRRNRKRKTNFESLKKFLISDMKLKQNLLELAPNERDDYNKFHYDKCAQNITKKSHT